jgi:Mn2+/Fe2+ NRAMP family transporter
MFNTLKKVLKILGPGVITRASDDDPSGIATYSQTGAQFGYGQLWTAPYLLPLLAGVQEACARIGVVTGKGIAAVARKTIRSPWRSSRLNTSCSNTIPRSRSSAK